MESRKVFFVAQFFVPFLGPLSDPNSKVVNVTNPTFLSIKGSRIESPGSGGGYIFTPILGEMIQFD